MGLFSRCLVPVLLLTLAACATTRKLDPSPPRATVSLAAEEAVPSDWKQVASPEDATRLADMKPRWVRARAEADQRYAKALQAEGLLLDPQAALDRPEPTPGRYRCRTVRLGKAPREAAFATFKPFFCFVTTQAPLLAFSKGTGTHRPGGWLWSDGDKRLIFLGGVAQNAKNAPPPYRTGAATNAVGIVERIDDFRWRLVLAGPLATNRIEIVELVPDTPPPTEAAR